MIAVHLRGTFLVTHAFFAGMVERGYGRIILTSSQLVNAIAPGPVETDILSSLSDDWRAMKIVQLPVRRFGRVEEMAPTALLLASEIGGRNYFGQNLSPNGGDVMV